MKERLRGAAGCLALAAICAALPGCGMRQKPEEPAETAHDYIEIGFSEVGAESDWRVAHSESMRNTFTEENGYELLFEDARQRQENQIAAIRDFILQEFDYIVVAPVIETGWDEVFQEAKDAGIPVIVVDRMVEVADDSLFTAWVGSDFHNEGVMAMEWLDGYLEEQGRGEDEIAILEVRGTEGASAQLGRTKGLMEGIEAHDNWTLTGSVQGEFTQAKAYEEVAAVLASGEKPDVIYCENDDSAFGAIQALEEAGISYGVGGDVIIISFDSTNAGLTACMEGRINLDVECNPLHGPRVEHIIRQLETGETPDKHWYVDETYFEPDGLTAEMIAKREY